MSKTYQLINEILGYVTAESKVNTDPRYLTAGSKNILIDRQRKGTIRKGIKRLGGGSVSEKPIRSQVSWLSSTGQKWMVRSYDDELEVYVGTHDGYAVNAWKTIASSLSTTEILRFATWWKDSESLDVLLFIQGDDNHYEWSGAVAVVESVTADTITKKGTATFAQNRFYAVANKTLINVRTGTEFAYTGGESTTTLTGVTGSPVTDGMVAGDVLVQKIVTHTNEPASGRNNDTIGVFENQVLFGSNDDSEVYLTANTDTEDTSFSAPRVAGEGGLFTLDGPSRGFGKIGRTLVLFAGEDSVFRVLFKEISVGTTLAEVLDTKRMLNGTKLGSYGADTILQLENAIIYLTNEPALRYFQDPEDIGAGPKTLSNPVKPDFDSETWTNAHIFWRNNGVYLTSPVNSRLYILEFVEDADGKLRRFWQPPQILPVRCLSELDGKLYAGSNVVAETYELFTPDTYSDMVPNGAYGDPDYKTPISAQMAFSYFDGKNRVALKDFDEWFTEGEVRQNTKIKHTLYYDYGGKTQKIEYEIDGSDSDILEETLLNASLGQQSLGQNPLGGVIDAPEDAAHFKEIKEIAREEFTKIQSVYSTETLDAYWSIIAQGPNARLSRRQNTIIKK